MDNKQALSGQQNTEQLRQLTDQQTLESAKEIERLQQAVEMLLRQVQTLQVEKSTLEQQLTHEQSRRKSAEQSAKRSKDAAYRRKCSQLQYRLNTLERKYQDLSSSKLGRLTLNYWTWQGKKGAASKKGGSAFLVDWLFNRLPTIQEVPAEVLPDAQKAQPAATAKEAQATGDAAGNAA